MKRIVCLHCILFSFAPALAGDAAQDIRATENDRPNVVLNRHGDPLDGPDVFAGYPTTYVIVRFQLGIVPNTDDAIVELGEDALDAALLKWGVTHATPYFSEPASNVKVAADLGLDRTYLLHTPKGTDTPALIDVLNNFGNHIEFAELGGIGGTAEIPNDTDFDKLYGMHNTGQTGGRPDADIDAPEAWDVFTGTDNVTLAVIDSGVDGNHSELKTKMVAGWNTNNNSNDTSDGCPHGTHVSGIAGAIGNNNNGVAGVSWGVKIMPVRVLNGCGGTEQQCADGIRWATDHGAHIGTMSLQYYTGTQAFRDAVEYAWQNDVLLIAATGNGRGNIVAYPAKFPHCMGIGATDHNDNIASFSNYGPECDVSAPGVQTWSCERGGGYSFKSGTSMATPHTSGLASLMLSFDPGLTPDEIEQLLKDTAEDKGDPGWDEHFGWGRINAFAAISNIRRVGFVFPDGVPTLFKPGGKTSIPVELEGIKVTPKPGSGKMFYAIGGGEFAQGAMVETEENVYEATFPAFECNDDVRFYFSAEDTDDNVYFAPGRGAEKPFEAETFERIDVALDDDFEQELGWTVVNENVSDGGWVRVIPDSSGDGSPPGDADGSGHAYVTGPERFQDLDGGPTRLISPRMDLSAGEYFVRYAYWFFGGAEDTLVVEISNDDGDSWTQVVVHKTGTGWRTNEITVSEFVEPNQTVRLRISATDVSPNSRVEAGFDAFFVSGKLCGSPFDKGDLNCDGSIDLTDVEGFVLALLDPNEYGNKYPDCDVFLADVNEDGSVDLTDVGGFIELLIGP